MARFDSCSATARAANLFLMSRASVNLDLGAGIAVCLVLGHGAPRHHRGGSSSSRASSSTVSNLYFHRTAGPASQPNLVKRIGAGKCFFFPTSGAEANEGLFQASARNSAMPRAGLKF